MKYIQHKRLDWKLSQVAFGGASLSSTGGGYGFGLLSESNAEQLVLSSLKEGINVFDTAPIYGFGQSERSLGKFLAPHREKVYFVSKAGVSWHENKRVNMTNDPKVVRSMFEQSLKDLKTDYIDIYMIHWPDKRVDIRRALEVLEMLQNEGKIRSIGLCNTNIEDLKAAEEICKIDFVQSEFNLFNSGFIDIDDYLNVHNIMKMGWGTFDKGILSSSVKLNTRFDSADCRSWAPWWKKSNWKEKVQKVQSFELSEKLNVKEIALLYSLQKMDISICGIKKNEHLDHIKNCLELSFDEQILKRSEAYFRG